MACCTKPHHDGVAMARNAKCQMPIDDVVPPLRGKVSILPAGIGSEGLGRIKPFPPNNVVFVTPTQTRSKAFPSPRRKEESGARYA